MTTVMGNAVTLTFDKTKELTVADKRAIIKFIEDTLPCTIATEIINYIVKEYSDDLTDQYSWR